MVAIYSVEGGALRKIPVTTVALGTMGRLTGSSVLAIRTDTFGIKATDSVLQYVVESRAIYLTLYILIRAT